MNRWADCINALVAFMKSPSFSISRPVEWTGYTKENTMAKDVFVLLDALHAPICRPEYRPTPDGTTHCNQFVAEVCDTIGAKGFDGMLANQVIDYIAESESWSEVPIEKCQGLANTGTLIIAALKTDPHGHVNIICPGREKTSGRWGNVPSCANVGKDIFIGKGINWAFSDMPKFYAWRSSL